MQGRDALHLESLLDSARQAHAKAMSGDRTAFDADENLQLAITPLIQRVGEAASRLSKEAKAQAPGIPRRDVVNMRHRLVHDDIHIDMDVVWETARNDLPPLIEAVKGLVE